MRLGSAVLLMVLACLAARAPAAPVADPAPLATMLAGLVDQRGQPLTAARLAGRLVLVNFIFTRCGTTCPTQTAELVRFTRSLPAAVRHRLFIVSISVDPAQDGPRQMQAYAAAFGADRRSWAMATGGPGDIARIARTFAAFRPGATGTDAHSSDLRLFDLRQRMVQRYAAAPLAERQLRADLLALAAARS